ncbi:MAG: EAL domain-containing protein [Pseudomonadota bacterium]
MTAMPSHTLSVLLVEDSPMDGRLLLEALRPAIQAGEVIVQTVKRLSLAIEALRGYDFSCVLLDLGLPDGNHVESVRLLREVDRKTAIIVLTGLADEKLAAEALALGAQDYLVKGENDGEQLLKQLRRAVQRNRQTYTLESRRDKAFFEASHDALTLLPNAALFADRARQLLAAARASQQPFGLACLQVTGLDALRAQQGDVLANELLKTLSERWSENLRGADTLARTGESEFVLCRQPAGQAVEWKALIEDCRHQLSNLQAGKPTAVLLGLEAAIIHAEAHPASGVDELLAAARAQCTAVSNAQAAPAALSATPHSANLTLRWQPWVDVTSLRCAGLELQMEAVPTASVAESAAWTLSAAAALVQQAQTWAATGFTPPLFALNVPANALESAGFVTALGETLSRGGMPPGSLQLEIGELAFRHLSQHAAALSQLRKQGFRLLMDGDGSQDISLHDFAACTLDGYRLSPILVRTLMDESLHGTTRRFISAILGASQQLGAVVIASGVDTGASADVLRLIGLRYMQGSALLPPLETAQLPALWDRAVALRG